MSYDSTNSDNNGFNINDDVRQNFWNAIWDLIHIQTNPEFDPKTYARVCCATSIWKIHVTEEEADYKKVAEMSQPNQNPNYTDIDTAANDPFNYPPAKKMIECMTQVGVNPQADLKLCLYHTYKSPKL